MHSPPPKRLLGVDGIRGLAALAVVTMHYSMTYNRVISPEAPLNWSNGYGGLGVHVFFAISGFVILLTLDRSPSIQRFAVGRFSRLFPVYWFSAVLTWLVITLSGSERYAIASHSALLNGSMLAGFFGHPHIDPVYWTLEAELKFYVLMAVLISAGARRFIVQILTILVLADIFNYFVQFTEWDGTGLWRLRLYLPLNLLYLFLTGIILFETRAEWRRIHCLAIVVCTFSLFLYNIPVRAGIVIFSVILLYAATRGRARWLESRPLLFLGAISYSLYLTHQINGYILLRWLHERGFAANTSVVFTMMLALLVASGLTFAVERPCHRLIRGRFDTRSRAGGIRQQSDSSFQQAAAEAAELQPPDCV